MAQSVSRGIGGPARLQVSTTETDMRSDADLTIEVREIAKRFGPVVAVDGVSFDVRAGEVVGLLGPNGAGKTTTMRLLTGYYTPDAGRVLIKGADTQGRDQEAKAHIGFLPESNPLYGDLLVCEYLRFIADLRGIAPAARGGAIDDAVEQAGIAEAYYRPIGQLSKGNRQRVGLAQAILHRPDILILDEPTEGLDPNQRMVIRELIRSLGGDRTVLLSTHVMSEVENTCDRILVINQGRLIADSPVSELLDRARGIRTISVEVAGEGARSALEGLAGVDAIKLAGVTAGRERYVLSVSGAADPRPEVFQLAKERGWELWELHEDRARLEDVFQSMTTQGQDPESPTGSDAA